MKIIGKHENGFILDTSKKELANLIGFYSEFKIGHIDVGAEIKVHEMYNQLYNLSFMETQLDEIANKLEHYSQALRLLPPIVVKVSKNGEEKV